MYCLSIRCLDIFERQLPTTDMPLKSQADLQQELGRHLERPWGGHAATKSAAWKGAHGTV